MNLLMDYAILFVVFLNWSQSSTASINEISGRFDKITQTSCGPHRLSSGRVDKSRLSCAANCKATYSTRCRSFMYNKNTKLCTPGGDISSNNQLATLMEGDLYYESNPHFNVVGSGSAAVNVAYFRAPLNYTDAEAACQRLNSHLFVMDTVVKMGLLNLIIIPQSYTWIGLDDRAVEGKYVWANSSQSISSSLKFSLFDAGQPDNGSGSGSQNCVAVKPGAMKLDDAECWRDMSYICERPTCQ